MGRLLWRLGVVGLIVVLLPFSRHVGHPYAVGQSDFQPEFVPSGCPEAIETRVEIECGFVAVPERHADPEGPTIRLAVMILRSPNPNPAPDPLVMAQGGPGGSTIDFFGTVMSGNVGTRFLEQRDIILIEQRGTFYSKPSLVCEEFLDTNIAMLGQALSTREQNDIFLEAARTCNERLTAEGINLSAFNSLENAADVPLVVTALSYPEYNYYGVSYGTMVAQHLMRDHPENLRSVIIDSVVPLDVNFIPLVPVTADRSFRLLFEACQSDAQCNADFPDLETVFFDLVNQLNLAPLMIPLTDPDDEEAVYDYALTGERLVEFLFQSLYVTSVIPLLPRFIYELADGNTTWVDFMLPTFIFNRTRSGGMYYSVLCAEDGDFDPDEVVLDAIYPPLVEVLNTGERFPATCAIWDVELLDGYVNDPITSDIPTLILSGEFDPITPPSGGALVAQSLSNSHFFTFPATAHGVLLGGECPRSIMASFLDNPILEPNSTCIADMGLSFAPAFSGRLVAVQIESQGIETVIPDGWGQFDNVIVRAATPVDQASIAFLGLGDTDMATFFESLTTDLGSEEPHFVETLTANDISWNRYDTALDGIDVVIMVATIESQSYAVLLFTESDEREQLVDSVLIPILEAFRSLN